MVDRDRRAVLRTSGRALAATGVLSATAGCLFGISNMYVDSVGGIVRNLTPAEDDPQRLRTTVRLVSTEDSLFSSNDSPVFEETYDLGPGDRREFEADASEGEHRLVIATESGPSRRETWAVDGCSDYVNVDIFPERVETVFTAC